MTTAAEFMTVAGKFGFRAARRGDLANEHGDLIQIAGERARLFLKDGRNFTVYSVERLSDLLRRLYPYPIDTSDSPQLELF